jgi:hypothetical protein
MQIEFNRRIKTVAIAMAISTLTAGCNSKQIQCKNVIKVVNDTVSQTESLTAKGTKGDTSSITQSAELWGKSAKEMTGINVEDEKLKTYKSQFTTMYQTSSEITKQIVASIQQKKSTQVYEGLRKFQSVISPEKDLVSSVNQYCKDPESK